MAQNVRLEIFNPRLTARNITQNRQLGLFVATTWHRYFEKYTPMDNGMLMSNVSYEPFKVIYNSPYAHYMHEGIKYIDPSINASGWFDINDGRWYSHTGAIKIPTDEPLQYSTEQHPLAQAHWEVPAYQAYSNEVANEVSQYLRRL